MKIKSWIKPEIISQSAYKVKTLKYKIKLNQNENPFDIGEDLKNQITNELKLSSWNRYPELTAQNLREKIAKINGLEPRNIVVGKGSNEVLQAISVACLERGKSLLTLAPTFSIYQMLAEQHGADTNFCFLDKDFKLDQIELIRKAGKANLIILCNPNSPTATKIDKNNILDVITSTNGLVVIDEAYFEFCNESCIDLLYENKNLIITRTFSKIFGLAAFRGGYAMMSRSLAEQIQKCMLPFNMDLPTTIAMSTLLNNPSIINKYTSEIIKLRDKLISDVNKIDGFEALPSCTNFFLVRSKICPKNLFNYLGESGILIRDVSNYHGCKDFVRISVGSTLENHELLVALEQLK